MTNSWNSITSAYTYEYGGSPYSANSCIVKNKPHYLKPQWFHVMPDSSLVIENEHENGFSDANLALINSNTIWGAMPMIKGDYWDVTDKTIITWIEAIDSEAKRTNLVSQITTMIMKYDWVGVEIDFEPTTIDATRSDCMTKITNQDIANKFVFLNQLSLAVHALNPKVLKDGTTLTRKVSVAIGATNLTTSDDCYQLVDYTKLALIGVDYIMVMNYDWWYSEDIYDGKSLGNRSSSPTQEFEDTIKWAIKTIPLNKIVMGIPDYGYNGVTGKDIQESGIIRYSDAIKLNNFQSGLYVHDRIQFGKDIYRGGGELWFNTGKTVAHIPTTTTNNAKRLMCEKYGIKQISMWAFAGTINNPTPWFTGKNEPLTLI
jgi:spore germination protein YaaH